MTSELNSTALSFEWLVSPAQTYMPFEHCVEQLGKAIRFGIFPAGAALPSERDLAVKLGVSRATVREAITALRTAGLVVTHRGRGGGTIVQEAPARTSSRTATAASDPKNGPHENETVMDVLMFREILEPGIARSVANRDLSPIERAWLHDALRDTEQATTPEEYRAADARFHLTLARLTGSPRVVQAASMSQQNVHDLLDRIPFLQTNIDHAQREHTALVTAISQRDGARAQEIMQQHCAATAALIKGLIS